MVISMGGIGPDGKMRGVSTLEYFKEFFKAIMQGRTDYENMLPMTIGIKK